jgi:hypothetical protein
MFYSMQDLPMLRPRTHNGFLDMQYDDRYTPFLKRAGLDVISFQVRRGLPMFNLAALTALVDMYYPQTLPPFVLCLPFWHVILFCLNCRWWPKTHNFHLSFREMTVTLQDSQKMLGMRIHGNAVTGPCRSEDWRAWVEAFLGREVPGGEQGGRTSSVLISWLRQEFA